MALKKYLDIANLFREVKDIAEGGVMVLYPKRLVRNTGININDTGFATYKGKEGVERYIEDIIEYNLIVNDIKTTSFGRIKSYFLAIPNPPQHDAIELVKNAITQIDLNSDRLSSEIDSKFYGLLEELLKRGEVDTNMMYDIKRVYNRNLRTRNS